MGHQFKDEIRNIIKTGFQGHKGWVISTPALKLLVLRYTLLPNQSDGHKR
jgi:hypothetical protein